jgi:integrase
MGKMNLSEQLRRSIDFRPGLKKRETKANIRANLKAAGKDPKKTQDWRVYSKSDAKALFQMASQFGRYAQHELGVRQARDLRQEHAEKFLDSLRRTGCTASTLKTYAGRLRHLSECVNHAYKTADIDFSKLKAPDAPKAPKREQMTQEQYSALMNCMVESKSKDAVRLAYNFGLRRGSLIKFEVRDVDLEKNLFTVYRDKDGRTRTLPIETVEQRELLTRLIAGKGPREKLINLKEGSVNRTVNRNMIRSGVCQNLLEEKTNIHSIRKLTAQERYDHLKEAARSKRDAAGDVSQYLGHGRNRKDIRDTYIAKE